MNPTSIAPKSFSARLLLAARSELAHLKPRAAAAQALAGALPQLTFNRVRTAILRAGGIRIGARSLALGAIKVTGRGNPAELFSIGSSSLVTCPLHVDLGARVSIGNNVYIGHDVALLTADHWAGPSESESGPKDAVAAPIEIEDGVWIGSRVVVLAGARIGAGAVVAAGAVVTGHVPPDTLVAGIPAMIIRDLDHGVPASSFRRSMATMESDPPPSSHANSRRGA
jgi:carbonic anhydrase/acetyltransferase-like protein (isoleucine patch superfamily)